MKNEKYSSIIGMPPPVSEKRIPMRREMRAAQFSPFAALVGYGDAIKETARLTSQRKELDENEKSLIDFELRKICDNIKEKPLADITYFQPDKLKYGGEVISVTGRIIKLSTQLHFLTLEDKTQIKIDDIYHISII